MKDKKTENRIHPRLNRKLPIKLAVNGYNFTTSTQNVSCVGTYCSINKYIPAFTRVMVKLTLPIAKRKNHEVACRGVVVRSENKDTDSFNIAIFFNGIADNQKRKISEYIEQFLPQDLLV